LTIADTTVAPGAGLTARDRGAAGDHLFRWVALIAGLLVLAVLALIAFSTTHEAWPAFRAMKLDFLTSDRWAPSVAEGGTPSFGAKAFLYGTFVVSAISLVIAVPVSLLIALFVTEIAPGRLRGLITTLTDLLAAVPSVVWGLWGLAVLAPNVVGFYKGLHSVLGPIPLLGRIFGPNPSPNGTGFMTAGMILAIMITPIVTSVMREVLLTVPRADKDGALALGATRWEMIRGVVVPHSLGGLVGAIMLGLGRAMGETIAVALVIGGSNQIVANVFKTGDAMPARVILEWGEAVGTHRSALMALGVVLFAMTIVVNVVARAAVARAAHQMGGG
jgi:phosphate transport system permease protein